MRDDPLVKAPQHEAWVSECLELYDQVRSHREPYQIEAAGLELQVDPNVFSPKYFGDSAWFAQMLPRIIGKGSLLDIGTGTGIAGLACAKNGARVALSDINPAAVACAQNNAKRLDPSIPVYSGDLYAGIPGNEKFDWIFFNHPFNKSDSPVSDMLLRAGFDHNYDTLRGYIKESSTYLTDPQKGLLLGTGNQADLNAIRAIAIEHDRSFELLEREVMPLGPGADTPNDFRIYHLTARV